MTDQSRSAGAAGFHADAEKAFSINGKQAWRLITSPEGLSIWLGAVPRSELKKGLGYRTKDGTVGQFLSVEEGTSIRVSWHPRGWETSSTLQVRIVTEADKISISFHHGSLAGRREAERMHTHWEYVLERLEELAPTSA